LQAKERFNHLQNIRFRVANFYRNHLNAKYNQLYWLSIAFEIERDYLKEELLKKKRDPKQTKKHKKLADKLDRIKPEFKEMALNLFSNRMRLYYSVHMLNWFLSKRPHLYTDMTKVSS